MKCEDLTLPSSGALSMHSLLIPQILLYLDFYWHGELRLIKVVMLTSSHTVLLMVGTYKLA
jgi:hypothetical protein